jgi:hypothetical protein|tara:strand:+ start:9520 stop:9714 length:195 start_codon:yes stop_codon:yes gene_type:complete
MEGIGFESILFRFFFGSVEENADYRVIKIGILFINLIIIIGNKDINFRIELFNKFVAAFTFEIK